MISVIFVAYVLGLDPTKSFIVISYSDDLAVDLHNETRQLVQSAFYKSVFPGTKISPGENTKRYFKTTKGGGRRATSVGGSLTGFGGDYLIVDDLVSAQDALSEKKIKNANDFFLGTISSRVNGMDTRTLMVMQRVAPEDVTSLALATGTWTHLCLPAIAINVEHVRIGPAPDDIHTRQPGEALHPEHLSLEWLNDLRKQVGDQVFNAQWQQQPTPDGGNLINLEYFPRYTDLPPYYHGQGFIQSWDPAVAGGEHNDYAVCTTWLLKGVESYLVDVFRKQMEFAELMDQVIALSKKYQPRLAIIEDEATGKALRSLLETKGFKHFKTLGVSWEGDKVTRAKIQLKKIREGKVFLPTQASWLPDFEKEVREFPAGKYDDQVDSMTQYLRATEFGRFWFWIKQKLNPDAF